ncbi:MAG: cytochrome c [Balneolales bacterium]|nr:cytochrome c [Balneolales bacterium]
MKYAAFIASILLVASLVACGNSDGQNNEQAQRSSSTNGAELSSFELEHGIGPITSRMTIDDFDLGMAQRGREIFESKCAACHQMENRLVGPPIKGLTERRSPEFLMNMILNPNDMARKHPEGQKMMREYMMVMPFQNISEEEAREIVEYFRKVDKGL